MLSAEGRRALRDALRYLEGPVGEEVQMAVLAVHEGIKPGATTLDQVTFLKGKADGMADLWDRLQEWAQDPAE
ncbi:hypothetical protein [Deinococcus sp. Leaf326]|uniref:hypothetical protein n=1 Tax=Deinococcus sp. Leaf326 TaxID=1736338 RepID=UPI0006FABA6F|nr:hypothetical protein [Deinococcus sp. Leaf326]KQR22872.1 hypothetical protein ASF71_06815 [Deinococcus sp. Leaf326]